MTMQQWLAVPIEDLQLGFNFTATEATMAHKVTGLNEAQVERVLEAAEACGMNAVEEFEVLYGAAWQVVGVECYEKRNVYFVLGVLDSGWRSATIQWS